MKILVHSNHPEAGTGYGQQTALLARLLKDHGHDVAISAFFGQTSWVCKWNDIVVYPGGYTPYGTDVLLRHAASHFGGNLKDGLIITLVDVWVLKAEEMKMANVACWTPIDHDPPPPMVLRFLEASGVCPVAMSRFGEKQLADAGLAPLYAPHSIDTDLFRPIARAEARRTMDLPEDAFIVGMVAANKGYPPRKGFPEAVRAFAQLRTRHPDALLYLHTEANGVHQGLHLPTLLSQLSLPADSVRFAEPYRYQLGFPPEIVANAYASMDVLLNPAYGEGFGIPIAEAQACGTPVIVTDWTSMPELVGAGWKVGGQEFWSSQNSWWKVPNIDELDGALEDAHGLAGDQGLRGQAREFAIQYDYRRVYDDCWAPVLAELEQRMAPLPLPVAA